MMNIGVFTLCTALNFVVLLWVVKQGFYKLIQVYIIIIINYSTV